MIMIIDEGTDTTTMMVMTASSK